MLEQHIPAAIPKNIRDLIYSSINKAELENIHKNFYSQYTEHELFQGNCLIKAPFINLPDPVVGEHPVMIVSNPCDTAPENINNRSPRVTYCAIKKLSKFAQALKKYSTMTSDEIESYVGNIKAQLISDILYLPKGTGFKEDMVVIFSQIASCDIKYFNENKQKAVAKLADKAYYILLTKLSIHFLRFGDLQQANTN